MSPWAPPQLTITHLSATWPIDKDGMVPLSMYISIPLPVVGERCTKTRREHYGEYEYDSASNLINMRLA